MDKKSKHDQKNKCINVMCKRGHPDPNVLNSFKWFCLNVNRKTDLPN